MRPYYHDKVRLDVFILFHFSFLLLFSLDLELLSWYFWMVGVKVAFLQLYAFIAQDFFPLA